MTELHNLVDKNGSGNMFNVEVTVLASVTSYSCSAGTCSSASVLKTNDVHGEIKCALDDASCVINAESSKSVLIVWGTLGKKLTFRAITFRDGRMSGYGAGATFTQEAIVGEIGQGAKRRVINGN